MGLSTSELLEMQLWQYNAYSKAFVARQADSLALQVQAAYYGAYWNGYTKGKKKSLKSVLDKIYSQSKKGSQPRTPIDYKKVDDEFRKMEELKNNGWTKCSTV